MMFIPKIFLLIVFIITSCESAKILAILTCASKSHGIWNRALMETLASRGHDVTAIIPDPGENTKNLKYISIREETYSPVIAANLSFINMNDFNIKELIDANFQFFSVVCENQVKSKRFQEIIKSNIKYDLIIIEATGGECMFGILPKLKEAPVVAITAFGCMPWSCEALGASIPISVFPDFNLSYTNKMTFWQRIVNILVSWYAKFQFYWSYMPQQERYARAAFGDDIPSLRDIEKNFSVLMVNEGPNDATKAFPASIIPVGCLQCRQGEKLAKDLQDFLDGASEGAIFFSLGTNAKCSEMTSDKLNIFRKVFSTLPQRIVWKCDVDTLPDLTKNVKLVQWVSQQDVLAHPNIRMFISHAGRLSTQESNYHCVPILSLPLFADQFVNSKRTEDQGLGIQLNYKDVTDKKLSESIHAILHDKKYKIRAEEVRDIILDQPETPMERAIFWSEYVIRHKGAPHLRSPTTQVTWYQEYFLDVTLAALLALALVYLTIKIVVTAICYNNKKVDNLKKKL